MNTLAVFLLSAMMVGVALSGTCSDLCKAPCNVAKKSCNFVFNASPICENNFNLCSSACDTLCACPDQCETQCTPARDTCLSSNAGNLVGIGICYTTFQQCAVQCNLGCSVQQAQQAAGAAAAAVGLA